MSHHNRPGTRTATATPTSGSQTITQNDAGESSEPTATLRLRAEHEERPQVRWAEDVVDNEGMGKKSSKVCCIYHKPKQPGESDSESDSSSDDDSDSEADLSRAQRVGGKGKGRGRKHDHDHDHDHEHGEGSGKGLDKERKPSPNAYERQPKHGHKKEG